MLVNKTKEDKSHRWAIATVMATTLPAVIKEVGQTIRAVMRERAIERERAADAARPKKAKKPAQKRKRRSRSRKTEEQE